MNREIARDLKDKAERVAVRFSNKKRLGNGAQETFTIKAIIPLSEHVAIVEYLKDSGKIAVAFFYYLITGNGERWEYFFPSDSHIVGFQAFIFYKFLAEKENYSHNFNCSSTENEEE